MSTSPRHYGISVHGELTSVWERDDCSLIRHLLEIYPRYEPKIIVDTTYGRGVMWRHSDKPIIGLDLDPERAKDCVADYCYLPLKDESVDVLIFDPPHLVQTGSPGLIKGRYSEYARNADPFVPFFLEARRVLKEEGLVLVKICDFITSARYHWRIVDAIVAIRTAGLCPCDLIIKSRKAGVVKHPFWKSQRHARKRHSYWIVVRRSNRC